MGSDCIYTLNLLVRKTSGLDGDKYPNTKAAWNNWQAIKSKIEKRNRLEKPVLYMY